MRSGWPTAPALGGHSRPRELLRRGRVAPKPGRRATGRWSPGFRQPLGGRSHGAGTVSDLALMLDAMAAFSTHHLLSRPTPMGGFKGAMHQGRPPHRIGFSADLELLVRGPGGGGPLRGRGVQRFGAMGTAVEGAAPDFSGARSTASRSCAPCCSPTCGATCCPLSEIVINPNIVWNIERGRRSPAGEIIQARQTRHALFHKVARFFDTYDLLVCPTVAVPPFPVEQRFPTEIAERR